MNEYIGIKCQSRTHKFILSKMDVDVARVESWNLLRWNACRITLPCVKSQYLALDGLPYSAFPADSTSRNFHPCIFVPLIPFSQFHVSQFRRPQRFSAKFGAQIDDDEYYSRGAKLGDKRGMT